MLYNLLYPLANEIQAFNLFKYLTFRSGGAMLTSLIISFLIGGRLIKWLKAWHKEGQPIRDDGPESHLETKKGTPTMGGIMILVSVFISTLLWADVKNPYVWITLLVTISFGLLGFMDDYLKVKKRNSKGVRAKAKLMGQMIVALIACLFVQKAMMPELVSSTSIPFFKSIYLDLGYFYAVFVMLVVVGSSNAVNLTDGLDGLAIVPIAIAAASFGFIAYLVGNVKYAGYLHIPYVAESGEIAVFCAALVGASLGFFWYNANPAQVFMGDTGSLALGGALGIISVITKHEIVLAIIGGLFVAEAVSVMLQVASFKTTGKRIFKMAPLHHHFEKLGWKETKVVARFWIVAVIFALIGLSTLKIR